MRSVCRAVQRLPAILLCVLWSAGPAVADEAAWKALNDQVVPHMTGGSLDKAEQFARQGLAAAEKSFGPAHRNTETSVGNLALVLRFQKRYEESEKHYRRVVALREKSQGTAHPATALMMLNLADVVQAQKKIRRGRKTATRGAAGL